MTTLNPRLVKFLAALAMAFLVPSIPASAFTTTAESDSFVTSGPSGTLANNNYGGAGSLSIAASGLPQGEFQTVLQFNLSGAVSAFNSQFGAGRWTIQSASLRLTAAPNNNAIFNAPSAGSFGISWMQNDSWQEGTGTPSLTSTTGITLNTLNSFIGANDENLGAFNFNGATSGATSYSLNLTPLFAADLGSGDNVSLRLFPADSAVSGVLSSRSFATTANRPILTVVAIPEPGMMALAGFGLALVTTWKLPRKKRA